MVPSCISSAVMHYGMFMHVSIVFRLTPIPGFFVVFAYSRYILSLSISWLSLNRQSAKDNCIPACTRFLCCIGGHVILFFVVCVMGLQHPF